MIQGVHVTWSIHCQIRPQNRRYRFSVLLAKLDVAQLAGQLLVGPRAQGPRHQGDHDCLLSQLDPVVAAREELVELPLALPGADLLALGDVVAELLGRRDLVRHHLVDHVREVVVLLLVGDVVDADGGL